MSDRETAIAYLTSVGLDVMEDFHGNGADMPRAITMLVERFADVRAEAADRIAELERERDAALRFAAGDNERADNYMAKWRTAKDYAEERNDECNRIQRVLNLCAEERDEARAQLAESQASAAVMREQLLSVLETAEALTGWDWAHLLIDGPDADSVVSDSGLLEQRLPAARRALAPNAGRDLLAEVAAHRARATGYCSAHQTANNLACLLCYPATSTEVAALRDVAEAARESDDYERLRDALARLDALTAGAPKEGR